MHVERLNDIANCLHYKNKIVSLHSDNFIQQLAKFTTYTITHSQENLETNLHIEALDK